MPGSTIRARRLPFSRLRRAAGVTRVARVTGLDRSGVEVACAVRPQGHVLQVSNGKGERFADAARGAVLEAAELWAAEHPPPGEGPLAFARGTELQGGRPARLPARAVWCPAPGERPLAGPPARWTSSGMGAHPAREAALLHALLEAVERDQLARALPRLWTGAAVARHLLDRRTLARGAPRAARLLARIARGGLEPFLFDLSPPPGRPARRRLALPLAAALIFDPLHGPVPAAAGYACALAPDDALCAALLEAAQSRLTDIHGAREDLEPMDPRAAALLRELCEAPPARHAAAMPRVRPGRAGPVAAVLARLRRAGFPRAVAVDLAPPGAGVAVVKVVVPGARLSGLL